MNTYGLIGFPLGHSFSKAYFAQKFSKEGICGCEYLNFPIESIEKLPTLIADTPTLAGFNVTIPYKEQVIPLLDELSAEAAAIGAVNCVKIKDGRLIGNNTDAYGFGNSLLELIGDLRPKALVLGTGGASKAVKYVLTELGIEYLSVSRTKSNDTICYNEIDELIISEHKLIVNTTPLGTYPNTEAAADIPYHLLTPDHHLFDLVYNPPLTRFLELGEAQGSRTMNGSRMLADQAEKSWQIWNEE